jgi:hypothetical protein
MRLIQLHQRAVCVGAKAMASFLVISGTALLPAWKALPLPMARSAPSLRQDRSSGGKCNPLCHLTQIEKHRFETPGRASGRNNAAPDTLNDMDQAGIGSSVS